MASYEDVRDEREESRLRRLRAALVIIILALLLGLAGLGFFVVKLVQPAGAPAADEVPEGLTWIRSIYGVSARPDDQFKGPTDVGIGPDGRIWVTESSTNRVMGFNPDGSFYRQLTAGAASGGKNAQGQEGHQGMISVPSGVVVGENNHVYVANFGSSLVLVFDGRTGGLIRAIKVPFPHKVALDGDRLFITSTDGLFLYTTGGKRIAKFSSRGAKNEQVDLPQGAAIGEDGTLIVSDTHNVQLKGFTENGKVKWANPPVSTRSPRQPEPAEAQSEKPSTTESASAESSPSAEPAAVTPAALAESLQLPMGMTVDGAGRLVFVDPFAFSIYVADQKDGTIRASYGTQGTKDGQFNYPAGIAYDASRDWFAVADTANGRVQIVRIEGSGGSAASAVRRLQGPVWLCSIPLLLLLLAVVVAVLRRRRKDEPFTEEG